MILIISTKYDQSTSDVIRWLNIIGAKWIRINEDDIVKLIFLDVIKEEFELRINGRAIFSSDISAVWFRRGKILTTFNDYKNKYIKKFLLQEIDVLEKYLWYVLLKKRYIGNRFNSILNKLIVLNIADDIGFHIPFTYIETNKKHLLKIMKFKNEYITKAISDPIIIDNEKYWIPMYTELLNIEKLKLIPNIFFNSLVQKKINKAFELRVVFFNNNFYSISIHSNKCIDVRRKMSELRYNCYELPEIIKQKINLIMKKLNLNFGIIDFIVDENHKYIFLEINPVGQFSYVANNCSYNLNRDIAEFLYYE